MKKRISILVGKCFLFIGKIFKKNMSVAPGVLVLKMDATLLEEFTLPPLVIAVTGSSGKGSTSRLIYQLLKETGKSVIYNDQGSNLKSAVVTLLIKHSKLNGVISKDALVVEIDERYTKYVFPAIKPNYVVITNITRDQPPRQGHFDFVYEEIKKALDPSMHLILNADDPYLQKFVLDGKNKVTYYSLDKNRYSYQKSKFENLNLTYCPKCQSKLEYNFYHFENIGDYYCPNCDFKKPNAAYHITRINYKNNEIVMNHSIPITLDSNILYSIYNVSAAYTVGSLLGIEKQKIAEILSSENKKHHGLDIYESNKKLITVLNSKNENSTTFNQALLYIERFKEEKTIVIGWKEISRRYHHDDLSWLYDIDFELLKKCNVKRVVCVGINCYDIATRLKYSSISCPLLTYLSLEEACEFLKTKKENIYAILNFDVVEPFNKIMKEGQK